MSASRDRVSRLELLKSRIDRLVERLHHTSFRDRLEREILVAELGRAIERLPSAAKARSRALAAARDRQLLLDSIEACAAVQSAIRALTAPEPTDAWRSRLTRLEDHLSLLLASEQDLLVAL